MYSLAREEFLQFISKYPEDKNIPKSKYYAASCLYYQKEYKNAIKELSSFASEYHSLPLADDAFIKIARSYFEIQEYDSAITIYKSLREKKPDVAYYWLGECHFKKGEYKTAILNYKKTPEESKYIDYSLYSIGFSLIKLKKYDDAIASFKNLKEQFPQSKLISSCDFYIAKSLYEKGDLDNALQEFGKIKEGKYKWESLFFTAECLFHLERYNDAITYYKKSLNGKYLSIAILGLGDSYYRLKDYKNAEENYSKLISSPKYGDSAAFRLGRVYFSQKNYEKAITYFKKSDSYKSRLMLANCLFEEKKYDEAIEKYKEISKRGEPLYRIALCLYKSAKYQEARDYSMQYLSSGEKALIPDVHLLLGEIAYKKKKFTSALSEYKIASGYKNTEKPALLGMAHTYNVMHEDLTAIKTLNSLVKKYPGNDTYYEAANIAYSMKDYSNAANWYKRVSGPFSGFKVGKIYFETGMYEKAIDGFKKFLSKYPLYELAPKAQYLIGISERKRGNLRESNKELAKLEQLYPSSNLTFDARCIRGDNHYDMQEYKNAEDKYRSALEVLGSPYPEKAIRPLSGIIDSKLQGEGLASALSIAESYISRFRNEKLGQEIKLKAGDVSYQAGDYRRAIKYYDGVSDPDISPQALYWKGCAYISNKKERDGIKTFLLVASRYPKSEYASRALFKVGSIYEELARLDEALPIFQKIVSNYPNALESQLSKLKIAVIYRKRGNLEEAERTLRTIRTKDKELNGKINLELAKLLRERGNFTDARRILRGIIDGELASLKPEAEYELGETYFSERNYKDASRAYLKVKYLYGENKFISLSLYKAAECELKMGDKSDAINFYNMVIKRNDDEGLVKKSKEAIKKIK
jgi:TolA-binding protein